MMYVIHTSSLVLFIYSIMYNLLFCTLSTQTHIVHVICISSAHVHIICLSSLRLLVYPIIHNLVSAHCLHTHTHIVHVICKLSAHVHVIYLSSLTLLIYYSCQVSRTTTDNVHLICICPDSMQMTCTYTNNSSRDNMYITYAFLNSIQMTSTICMC